MLKQEPLILPPNQKKKKKLFSGYATDVCITFMKINCNKL